MHDKLQCFLSHGSRRVSRLHTLLSSDLAWAKLADDSFCVAQPGRAAFDRPTVDINVWRTVLDLSLLFSSQLAWQQRLPCLPP